MARQNYMVATYSEIALEQFEILRENYQSLEGLDKMCGEALALKHDILNGYVYVITFAAMALEAFLNDYAADKMGDAFFYENFESLRPFSKLQLIAKVLYNTTLDTGEKVYCFVNQLFKERNHLVHSKSRELIGMSQEEWNEFNYFLETDENASNWLIVEHEKLDISEEKESFASAHQALRGLKEVHQLFCFILS